MNIGGSIPLQLFIKVDQKYIFYTFSHLKRPIFLKKIDLNIIFILLL